MSMQYLKNVVTLHLIAERCTGCGMCVEVCPHAVFSMNGKHAYIQNRDACIECGACAKNCAWNAISVRAGVGCATAYLNSFRKKGAVECGCATEK
jgi:NAD-dependent dihydropyrimidine dehydrogenase PreA subunit